MVYLFPVILDINISEHLPIALTLNLTNVATVADAGEQISLPHDDQNQNIYERRESGDVNYHQGDCQRPGEQSQGRAQYQVGFSLIRKQFL